jgi:hypothetical protein
VFLLFSARNTVFSASKFLDMFFAYYGNFTSHWERLNGDPESQHELVKLIVERAYIEDEKLVAMTLLSNYHLVLGHKANGPTFHEVDPLYAHGSDGDRTRDLRLDRPAC